MLDKLIAEPTKALLSIEYGVDSGELVTELKRALSEHFTFRNDYLNDVATERKSFPKVSHGISVSWLHRYICKEPACLIALMNTSVKSETDIITHVSQLQTKCSADSRGLFVIFIDSDEMAMSRIGKACKLSSKCYLSISRDTQNKVTIISKYVESIKEQCIPFYRERLRKYKRSLYGGKEGHFTTPMQAIVHYQFKIGWMEMEMGQYGSAIKSFNTAYSSIIENCRKLQSKALSTASTNSSVVSISSPKGTSSTPTTVSLTNSPSAPQTEDTPTMQSILEEFRWICDVMTVKVILMMMMGFGSGDERPLSEPDDYFNGHIKWFTPSHTTEQSLCEWKASLYQFMANLLSTSAGDRLTPDVNHHPGYYYFLAGKYMMAIDDPNQTQTEQTVATLIEAYDYYQNISMTGTTLQIGRLIASQYIRLGNHSQALQ